MISVCSCDPQPIIHQGLATVLGGTSEFEFVDSSLTLEDVISQVDALHPGIVLIDRSFGMHALVEAIMAVRRCSTNSEIVVWAANISDVESFRLFQAGARGVVRKTADVDSLLDCFRTVIRKQLWTENLVAEEHSPLGRPRSRPLTPREQQVAELVSKGMKNREIAEALDIATGTVKIHLMHIFEKTGIRDRFELALHGLRLACESERGSAAASSDPLKPALRVSVKS